MNYYIQLFWRLFVRKETPANVPASQALLMLLIMLTFILSVIAALTSMDAILKNLAGNLVDLIVLALFTHFLLDFYKRRTRFLQVFIALVGIKVVFQMFTVPGVMYIATVENLREPNTLLAFISILMLVLLVVTLRAIAHVYVLALDINNIKAIMFSLLYYIINLFVTLQLFAGNQADTIS